MNNSNNISWLTVKLLAVAYPQDNNCVSIVLDVVKLIKTQTWMPVPEWERRRESKKLETNSWCRAPSGCESPAIKRCSKAVNSVDQAQSTESTTKRGDIGLWEERKRELQNQNGLPSWLQTVCLHACSAQTKLLLQHLGIFSYRSAEGTMFGVRRLDCRQTGVRRPLEQYNRVYRSVSDQHTRSSFSHRRSRRAKCGAVRLHWRCAVGYRR